MIFRCIPNNNLPREALKFNKLLYFAWAFYGKIRKWKQKRIIHISNRIKFFPFSLRMCCAKHNNLSSGISFFDWARIFQQHEPSEKVRIAYSMRVGMRAKPFELRSPRVGMLSIPKKSINFPRIISAHEEIWKLESDAFRIIHLRIKHKSLTRLRFAFSALRLGLWRKLKNWFIAFACAQWLRTTTIAALAPSKRTTTILPIFNYAFAAVANQFPKLPLASKTKQPANNPSKIHLLRTREN